MKIESKHIENVDMHMGDVTFTKKETSIIIDGRAHYINHLYEFWDRRCVIEYLKYLGVDNFQVIKVMHILQS